MPEIVPLAPQKVAPAGSGAVRAIPAEQGSAVRWEAACEPSDEVTLSAAAQRYHDNEGVLDSLLDPSTSAVDRGHLMRDLGVLPPPLLRAARDHGVHLWVAPDGAVQAPVHLFEQSAACRASRAALEPAPGSPPAHAYAQVPGAWATVAEPVAFVGNVFAFLAGDGPETRGEVPHAGQDLKRIAWRRGARTPEQSAAFVRRAVELNTQQGHPIRADHVLRQGEKIMLPDVYFYQGHAFRGEDRRSIDLFNEDLRDAAVKGSYSYKERLVMLKASSLPDPAPQGVGPHRVALHEMGHVAEHLLERDAGLAPAHIRRMQALHDATVDPAQHAHRGGAGGAVTEYARSSRVEHYAEGFEAYWTATRRDAEHQPLPGRDANVEQLRHRAPGLFDVIHGDMQRWQADAVHPRHDP